MKNVNLSSFPSTSSGGAGKKLSFARGELVEPFERSKNRMREVRKTIAPLFFYGIITLLFFVDITTYMILERPLFYTLLCFYIMHCAFPFSWSRIVSANFLLSLLSLIQYGRFGLCLIYLIPATLLRIKMHQTMHEGPLLNYLILVGCLAAQIGLIEHLILGLPISALYTASTIIANIIVMTIFSLKLYT